MPVFLPQIHALEKALPVHNKRDGVPEPLLSPIGKEESVWYDRQNVITEVQSAQRRSIIFLYAVVFYQ